MPSQPHDASGGGFLLAESTPGEVFTAEDLTDEHHAIAETVNAFWDKEIAPHLKEILEHKPGLVRTLMKKASEIGLMGISIPRRYGGTDLDLISALVVSQNTARDASYMIWEGGHNTIGTLPIVYFGTDAQKERYLPRLARLEMVAAYALSEPQAGSDALAVRTRAALSDGGRTYVLNGQKMWISNASEADIFTVFARVDGQHFTAFLVERSTPGLRVGAEERKMGLRGSSTTALYLDDVQVPVENVLGEVGRGHVIAFNILNVGRLKMGASAIGAAREVLRVSIAYANDRHAFGSSIAEFGAIRHKLAEMAIRIFATESVVWRTAGLIAGREEGVGWNIPDAGSGKLDAIHEFAIECSIVKVFSSEMLDYVVDEGVQIHGGYGYHEDYYVEKAYRDSRINRIFEGTNEINRLLIVRMLLKRGYSGTLPLLDAVDRAIASAMDTDGCTPPDPRPLVVRAKAVALLAVGLARRAWPEDLENRQELLILIADILIDLYAMESTTLRTVKIASRGGGRLGADIDSVFVEEATARIAWNARQVVGASVAGSPSEPWIHALRHLLRMPAGNMIQRRQRIAAHLIDQGGYGF